MTKRVIDEKPVTGAGSKQKQPLPISKPDFGSLYGTNIENSNPEIIADAVEHWSEKIIEALASRLNTLEEEILKYRVEVKSLNKKLEKEKESSSSLSKELHENAYLSQIQPRSSEVSTCRYFPVRVYIGNEQGEHKFRIAVEKIFGAINVLPVDEYRAERGSWFKQWMVKTLRFLTSEEMLTELEKIKRGVELTTINAAQAKIDKEHADAAATLIGALDDQDRAVLQIGSLLIVKVPSGNGRSELFTRTLTQKELIFLEKNQHLLRLPEEILEKLSDSFPKEEQQIEVIAVPKRGLLKKIAGSEALEKQANKAN